MNSDKISLGINLSKIKSEDISRNSLLVNYNYNKLIEDFFTNVETFNKKCYDDQMNLLVDKRLNIKDKISELCIDYFNYSKKIKTKPKKKDKTPVLKILGIGGFGIVIQISHYHVLKLNITEDEYYHEFHIPIKLKELDPTLKDLIILPDALIKNLNCERLINEIRINILVCKLINYFNMKNLSRNLLKVHFPIINKQIDNDRIIDKFEDRDIGKKDSILICKKILVENGKKERDNVVAFYNFVYENYLKKNFHIPNIFLNLPGLMRLFRKEKYKGKTVDKKKGFVIIMPKAEFISIEVFLNDNLQLDNSSNSSKKGIDVFPHFYRMLFLQVSIFILKAKKFHFMHNDLKPDNVLVTYKEPPYILNYNNQNFYFDNESFIFKISDFDFSTIPDYVENKKINNTLVGKFSNWFCDIHYFVHMLFVYINKKDILKDAMFFKRLYNVFILPYCQSNYKNIENIKIIKDNGNRVICRDCYYLGDKFPKIDILFEFIKSDLFERWHKNKINKENSKDYKDVVSDNDITETLIDNFENFFYEEALFFNRDTNFDKILEKLN